MLYRRIILLLAMFLFVGSIATKPLEAQVITPFHWPQFHPTEDIIAVTNGETIRIYTSDFVSLLKEYKLMEGEYPGITRVGFMKWSPDGNMLAISFLNSSLIPRLQIWELDSDKRLLDLENIDLNQPIFWGMNSDYIVATDKGLKYNIRFYEVPSGDVIEEIVPSYFSQFAWNAAVNQALLAKGPKYDFRVLNTLTHEIVEIDYIFNSGYPYEYNPSGTLIAGIDADNDELITIYDTHTYTRFNTLIGHQDTVFSVSWFNDTILVSNGRDRTVRFWNVQNGKNFSTFNVAGYSPFSFNHDKTLIAFAEDDNRIHVRDMATGEDVAVLGESNVSVSSLMPVQIPLSKANP